MKKLFCVIALALCSLPAAAARPDWADGNSSKFPRELYMTGVGIASDRASAEQRARAAVSRIFTSLVNDVSQVNASENFSQGNKGKGSTTFSQNVSQNVQITSDKLLEGVEIGDSWKEPKTGQYYSLAVLDRSAAAATLKSRIGDIDSQINQWNLGFSAAKDNFGKAKYAARMIALLKQRDSLDDDLRIVDPKGAGAGDAGVSAPELRQALEKLDLQVSCDGDGKEQVCSGLLSALSGMGFMARENSQSPDIAIKASVSLTDLEHLSGDPKWFWYRATVALSAKDAAKGAVFMNFEVSYKSASVSASEASRTVLQSIAKQAADKTVQGLNDYFQNQ